MAKLENNTNKTVENNFFIKPSFLVFNVWEVPAVSKHFKNFFLVGSFNEDSISRHNVGISKRIQLSWHTNCSGFSLIYLQKVKKKKANIFVDI